MDATDTEPTVQDNSDHASTTGTEIYALDLDWDLILHLAKPESVSFLQSEQFNAKLLEDDLAKDVWEWQISHTRREGKPATASVLEDEFPQIAIEEPQAAIGDLVERLRARYMRNSGHRAIKEIARLANEDPLSVGSKMLRVGRELADLTTKRGEVFGTGDYARAMDLYDKKALEGPGPTLGFADLDDHFGGIKGVTFMVAPPKTWKSWWAVNDVIENVYAGGMPYIYSLELPADETDMRIRCMAADIPFWKYDKRIVSPDERKYLQAASSSLDESGVYRVEKPEVGNRNIHVMVERAMNAGASLIIIDQLQYVEDEKGNSLGALNNPGDYFKVCNTMRNYSDEIPLLVVHQFNRSVMNAKGMPEMQQLKGAAAMEEVGTLLLGMWCNKEMRRNNVVELGTLASRTYNWKSWQLEVRLSRHCQLEMIGEVEDEDE